MFPRWETLDIKNYPKLEILHYNITFPKGTKSDPSKPQRIKIPTTPMTNAYSENFLCLKIHFNYNGVVLDKKVIEDMHFDFVHNV